MSRDAPPQTPPASPSEPDRSAPFPAFGAARTRLWRRVAPEWITRDMGLIIAARAAMSVCRALAGIITPIYLALIGFSGVALGLTFTAVALTSAALSALIGALSDRVGRKVFLVVIPLLASLAAVTFAFSSTTAVLVIAAALGSFGRGAGAGTGMIGPYQPAEQALLADAVPPRWRTDLFGRVAFASSLGALIGGPLAALAVTPAAGASIAQIVADYRPAFLAAAVGAALAGLIVLPIKEPPRGPAPMRTDGKRESLLRPHLSAGTWRILLRLWATNSVNGLAVGFFGPFITYWLYRRYGATPGMVGALFAIINLAGLVANLMAARFAARLGLVNAIFWGRLLQALLIIPMVLAPTFWLAGAVYLVRMMAQRVALPLRQSYVMGVILPSERGTAGALSSLPMQVTSAVSPIAAGYLFDEVSLSLPFEVGALLQGINATLFYLFFRHRPPPEERQAAPADATIPKIPLES
ncbi:MAG TPA: MFS transporter [Ktedonobacterales bacterium]|nr:MFS transporter [Ktedonobacterales bacterium]